MTPRPAPTPGQRAAARADLLLAQVHELASDLDRDRLPVPAGLKDASTALAQAAAELHEHAGRAGGYAGALARAIREQDARGTRRLADQAEAEARHLLELATSAAVHGLGLPWGVEQAARSLTDWARRHRQRAQHT